MPSADTATGVLSLVTPPDFEAPADFGANNTYNVIVQASDGQLTDQQSISVAVQDVNEGGGGIVWNIDGPPPRWFLAGKPPRNWAGGKFPDGKRWDVCPRCKAIRIKELQDVASEHPGALLKTGEGNG